MRVKDAALKNAEPAVCLYARRHARRHPEIAIWPSERERGNVGSVYQPDACGVRMNFREVYKGVAFRLSLRLWMCVGVGLCSIVSHSLWELWQVFAAAMCVCGSYVGLCEVRVGWANCWFACGLACIQFCLAVFERAVMNKNCFIVEYLVLKRIKVQYHLVLF